MFRKIDTRSIIALIFSIGSLYLAIIDESYRKDFAFLAGTALGGYLGQLIPHSKKNDLST